MRGARWGSLTSFSFFSMKGRIITEGEITVFIKDFINYEGNVAQFWCF